MQFSHLGIGMTWSSINLVLGTAQKLIGNALPISAIVGKVKLAMNLGRIVDLMPLYRTHSASTHTQMVQTTKLFDINKIHCEFDLADYCRYRQSLPD